jgi:alpha-tubulin suppressor-like RCC1 family protein
VDVAAGAYHALALAADGIVRATGRNSDGQLGRGNTNSDSNGGTGFQAVSGLSSVVAIAAGTNHSLALRTDGSVQAWGDNLNGQLGDAMNVDRLTPVVVQGLPPARLLAAGSTHSCAVTEDEEVYCWGANGSGQLGTGDQVESSLPKQVFLY